MPPRQPLADRAKILSERSRDIETYRPPEITDWHLPENESLLAEGLIYPGPKFIPPHQFETARELRQLAAEACYVRSADGQVTDVLKDYRFFHSTGIYRGHRQQNTEGILHILRVTPPRPPLFSTLGLDNQVVSLLCGREIGDMGGLVIVSGEPGHGKTTTCSSLIVERVTRYASFCLTVEDPPEFVMSGNYETANKTVGKIIQIPASSKSFSEDLRDALRCYPANSRGAMLLVGEVRDSDSAAQVLRAAANGLLVIMTTHAGTPLQACSRLVSLAGSELAGPNEANELLGATLRAVIHQRLLQGKLSVSHLFSLSEHSHIRSMITNGNINLLGTELETQRTQAKRGTLERYVLNGAATGDSYAG